MKVLVLGGTGYLGQFVVDHFLNAGDPVLFTHTKEVAPEITPNGAMCWGVLPAALRIDLTTEGGLGLLEERALQMGCGPDVVINCAAISQPRDCESDRDRAFAVNVPSRVTTWLTQRAAVDGRRPPLFIHLSTDQTYEGNKPFWHEDDPTNPVNTYGESKVAAERHLQESYPNHAILRSSIIYGPQPPLMPVGRTLPLAWMDGVLSSGQETSFFEDEFRNPVYVGDVVAAIAKLAESAEQDYPYPHRVFNLGGPERLSRVDMALAVARERGYSEQLVKPVPAASVSRGVVSPADISMNVERIQQELGISLTPFVTGVQKSF
ncbi:Rossmann-fold NAD(P)-binding domain-containing protein [Klebsormidium nitens]|uniref:Rossmann-fold NAD(P)-binding domain-containing protein n=1 Tax=Klebsormidium nitens TaxID=105231 RepID=A0A0U9I793_KLENI|nr:Rossmann-fold NAD(P)-binding domain-containing protein [Klebsormidium nitens]|eukprot:GAQ82491.1 Rossmann-fold NAD(P)-binding domain-containing protein [Klebsormidium nitens]